MARLARHSLIDMPIDQTCVPGTYCASKHRRHLQPFDTWISFILSSSIGGVLLKIVVVQAAPQHACFVRPDADSSVPYAAPSLGWSTEEA